MKFIGVHPFSTFNTGAHIGTTITGAVDGNAVTPVCLPSVEDFESDRFIEFYGLGFQQHHIRIDCLGGCLGYLLLPQ
ncbi:hypothetical protein D3C85_1802600 [compost metagenome]